MKNKKIAFTYYTKYNFYSIMFWLAIFGDVAKRP